ncbi:hypothetical protein [Pedobacter jamesrossensis]|uniref:DUF4377 domain-containing protein n=1 Tax=Pedobacter jamesrossensis TaxID=1908238 RepID=A0ABV8NH49_9SPHI
MRKLKLLTAVLSLLFILSCKKRQNTPEIITSKASVIQDCVATYLKLEAGQTYRVCNLTKAETFKTGEQVSVVYYLINVCNGGFREISCYKTPIKEDGVVYITEIKVQ